MFPSFRALPNTETRSISPLKRLPYSPICLWMDQAAPATHFNLLSAIDEALRDFLSAPGRSDLIVALVADATLPLAACGDRRHFVRLLRGMLEAALQSTQSAELLLEVTLMEEDSCFAWVRFSAAHDCTRLSSDPRNYAAIYLAWRLRKAPPGDAAPCPRVN